MSSKLHLRIFDGSRQPFSAPAKFLITITDGQRNQQVRDYYDVADILFELPFYDNLGDNYTVNVWAEGFKQVGFMPVTLSDQYTRILDLMLVPDDPGFSFVNARFDAVSAAFPFVAHGLDNAAAQTRYDQLLDQQENSLACLLNLVEAMRQIHLPQGTPLDYIKQLRWDPDWAPRQDRFFAWCDPALIHQVKAAADRGLFAEELNPGTFHAGATSSWKQIEFGEANVQLTFHENDHAVIDGLDCIMVEPDIDYYKDLGAHAIFEVIPNAVTHSLTDPAEVYVLRWIAGRQAGVPEFAPLYTLTS